jgi:hypothetical protein
MENRSRLLVIVLVGALALLGGIAIGAVLDGGPAATTPPVAEASSTPEPTAAPSEEPASEDPAASSAPPSASAEPSASPGATPAPTATVTIGRLFLDAEDNPEGTDRVIRWAGATGGVTAEVQGVAPGSIVMCLRTPEKELGCRTAGSGTLKASTTKPRETYLLVLRGNDTAQPLVDVTLTFPARNPKVTIENARFDGTDYPDTNGIQAIVTPRTDGPVEVVAEWGGKPFLYELDVIEEGGAGSVVIQSDESATSLDTAVPVTATNPWRVVLQNIEPGIGATPLTASISWP